MARLFPNPADACPCRNSPGLGRKNHCNRAMPRHRIPRLRPGAVARRPRSLEPRLGRNTDDEEQSLPRRPGRKRCAPAGSRITSSPCSACAPKRKGVRRGTGALQRPVRWRKGERAVHGSIRIDTEMNFRRLLNDPVSISGGLEVHAVAQSKRGWPR